MGGPKINTNSTLKNRLGRKFHKAKGRGGGKAMRKKVHSMKKAKNMEKKMLRYYGEVWKGNIDPTKEPEKHQISRESRVNSTALTGKKMRKIRKRSQSRHKMEVEIAAAQKSDGKTKKKQDTRTENKDKSQDSDDEYEDVEMQEGEGDEEEAKEDTEEA